MTAVPDEVINASSASAQNADDVRRTIVFGVVTILALVGAFAVWALLAPLDSAVIAPGTITVEHNRKTVKHLRGGIVTALLIAEGDQVIAGDVLLRIDDTDAKASIALLSARQATLEAMIARLSAERENSGTIKFPGDFLARANDDTEAARAIAAERYVFTSRAEALADQIDVLESRAQQMQEVILGTRVQLAATRRQRILIAEELNATQQLYERGFAPKTRLLALKRGIAQLDGRIGEERATIARSQAAIGEVRLSIIQLRSDRNAEIAREFQSTHTQWSEISAKLTSAKRTLDLADVRAPTSGTVFNLQAHTIGGVVISGEPILDIVPSDTPLIVEANVSTSDIDDIRTNMPAEIRLSGFTEFDKPIFDGVIIHVSADSLKNERSGEEYFKVKIQVDRDSLLNAGDPMLIPGMRADVVITTEARTAFDFFLGPIIDSLYFSTRER